ncbi:acyl carrier protein [Streptomyces sp. NBC_00464]|uniref:acyl carrier protein n=1 Tax=unclassified Streptomyces TaxID=2593676 RepID=UPI002DD9797C|nr:MULTISPECIES: acyl carrier protein [unclassified Streptomyces]MEE4490845.1 acyl carrier protein [Streptomyces sp. BE230]WRZ83907.1 acyl carrier protein [Streptomyces sp. NBC_01022]
MPEETIAQDQILAELKAFIEERFLPEGTAGLEADAPLLQLGILTSLNTTELIAHVQARYRLYIPPEHIVGRNFRTLENISALVFGLQGDPAAMA